MNPIPSISDRLKPDDLEKKVMEINKPVEERVTRIATTIRDLSDSMEHKIQECDMIFTSGECRELDAAYDKGIDLVEQLLKHQESTIAKLRQAKGREGNWQKLNIKVNQISSKVSNTMKSDPLLQKLVRIESQLKKMDQMIEDVARESNLE